MLQRVQKAPKPGPMGLKRAEAMTALMGKQTFIARTGGWFYPYPRGLSAALMASVVTLCLVADAAAQPKSKGVYRIPYENGTTVKVTNDHKDHKPVGRIDMGGTGGGRPYKIVAAAAGYIRFIVDGFSKQVDSSSGDPCKNNYVWIEHANGEWTKYSHMTKTLTKKTAKLKVGHSPDPRTERNPTSWSHS